MNKQRVWKRMWTSVCIAFGCWVIAMAGGMQSHAVQPDTAAETSIGDTVEKSSAIGTSDKVSKDTTASSEDTDKDTVDTSSVGQAAQTDSDQSTTVDAAQPKKSSNYTVDFAYDKLQYSIKGGTTVPLSDILQQIGISGTATAVQCSNPNLFSASQKSGSWTITSHKAFSTTEWMKVTLDGKVYDITVTDDDEAGIEWDETNQRYKISNYNGLLTFAKIVNGEIDDSEALHVPADPQAACAILTKTIVCSGEVWTPIGSYDNQYTGTFDGDGKEIQNLTYSNDEVDYAGLFGYVGSRGKVQNVGLVGGSITGKQYVGAVVGYNNSGTVENCYNTGVVSGSSDNVGGVVGDNNGGTVQNCYNTGEVSGNNRAGGVVGGNYAIKTYQTTGTVKAVVTNCHNTGSVTGVSYGVGGVVGYNDVQGSATAQVTNSYNTGKVSGNGDVGGVVGMNEANIYDGTATAQVINGYNTGEVRGNSSVGGVVGYNSVFVYPDHTGTTIAQVINSYNTGAVTQAGTATDDVYLGGVVGENRGTVTNCYNTGVVIKIEMDESIYVGGVIGYNKGTVQYCYYDSDRCTGMTAIGSSDDTTYVKGLTTAKMTGEDVINYGESSSEKPMCFHYADGVEKPWLTKADEKVSASSAIYYWFYPHLKGFNFDPSTGKQLPAINIDAADWPPKVEVRVSWSSVVSFTYDGNPHSPSATVTAFRGTASSYTVPVEYEYSKDNTSVGEHKDAGRYTVSIVGHEDFKVDFMITQKALTIKEATAFDKVYDGNEVATINGASLNGVVTGETVTATYSGKFEDKNVGTEKKVTVTATLEGDNAGNYSVGSVKIKAAITARALTITGVTAQDKEYDGNKNATVTGATINGLVEGDVVTVKKCTGTFDTENIGEGKPVTVLVELYGEYAENYTVGSVNEVKANITKRPVIFIGKSESKNYTGKLITINTVSVSENGLVEGHNHNVTFTASGTDAGTYPGTITAVNEVKITKPNETGETDVTSNYAIIVNNGTLTIKQITGLAITFNDYSHVYDASPHCIEPGAKTNAPSGITTIQYSKDNSNWTDNLSDLKATNVLDSCTIYVQVTNPNYSNTATKSAQLTINPKHIRVMVDNKSKVYGSADPELTATVDGLVGSDKLNYTLSREAGEDVGTYAITGTYEKNPNYDVEFVDGTLTITSQEPDPDKPDDEKTNGGKSPRSEEYQTDDDTNSESGAYKTDGNVSSESKVYKTSDVIPVQGLLGLELLMMLAILGLYFSLRRQKI